MLFRMNAACSGVAFCALAMVLLAGCGGTSEKTYIPRTDAARSALTAAMAAWQSGQPKPGTIPRNSPVIEVVDSEWRKGQKLKSFEILQEIPTTEGPKRFSVKLTMEGATAPQDTVYLVVGKDPLYVFREADYQPPTGM